MAQLILEEGAAPSTPATGKVALYAKTDSKFYTKDDAGTESLLGAVSAQGMSSSAVSQGALINSSITASVGSNALTIALKTQAGTDPSSTDPVLIAFRSSTLTSGAYVVRSVTSALSVTISSGSTLGTTSGVQSRIAVLAIDNAGTVELAAVNIAGGTDLSETGVISTTAEGGAGAADSASVIYSTTARSNVAYRVVGYVESTQATAGTWATSPSTIQGAGNSMAIAKQAGMLCRAWVNFNGTGTVAIRASFNVSSITDNGTGDYTVNFTTALPDINYCFVGCGSGNSTTPGQSVGAIGKREDVALTTTAARMIAGTVGTSGGVTQDVASLCVAFFR